MHEPWAAHQEPLAQLGPTLCECAAHVEAGSMEKATRCLARANGLLAAAAGGGSSPQRRLAAPMVDCLARCILRPIPAIADALIDPSEWVDRRCVRAARRGLFELSPFPKAAYAVSNRAIIEATENEKYHVCFTVTNHHEQNVHVIDFAGPAAHPLQWIELMHDFHRRPEGPPHLRLTVVHDDKESLSKTSKLLADEAEELGMAFQFHYVVGQIETLDFSDLHGTLHLKPGEARAIICTQQLHRLLATADDASTNSYGSARRFNEQVASVARLRKMASLSSSSSRPSSGDVACCEDDDDEEAFHSPDTPMSFVSPPASTPPPSHQTPPPALASFLSAARAQASPRVLVVTEQDASHNGVSFRKRFAEALHYYAAAYGCLDAAAAAAALRRRRRPASAAAAAELVVALRQQAEVERAVLGEEVRDVLLREGARRRERHDRLPRWAARMERAGFRGVPLSYAAIRSGDDALRRRGVRGCENREHAGCVLMCWGSCPLFSVSAWRPNNNGGGETEAASGDSQDYLSASSQMMTTAGTWF
ncbi:hypothetical protein EJB05_02203, partial [Eragrostis curvula]